MRKSVWVKEWRKERGEKGRRWKERGNERRLKKKRRKKRKK